MSCPEWTDRIHDHAGGYLTGAERQAVDEHLLVCPACREELRAIRALLDDIGGLPKSVEPPEEVWVATRQRLGAARREGERRASRAGSFPAAFPRGLWMPLAAAAAVVLVAALVLYQGLPGKGAPVAGAAPSGGAPVPSVQPASLAPPDLDATEAEFARVSAELMAALEKSKDRIPPETMAVIQENLRAINAAIAETRSAMEKDPDNARLGHLMRVMYLSKMRLLQGAAVLPSG